MGHYRAAEQRSRERGGLIYSLHGAQGAREEDNLLASSPREIGATFQRDDSTNDVVFKEMIISSGLINCRHAPPSLFRDRKSRVMFGGVYSNEQLGCLRRAFSLSLSLIVREMILFLCSAEVIQRAEIYFGRRSLKRMKAAI
jgi:hypothetical protein